MIEASHLAIQFGEDPLFENISFQVQKGEIIGLIGPSGSGKTVLLKMIAQLLPPIHGSVTCQSQAVSMLFQRNALFDSLSVEENLLFPLREKKGLEGQTAQAQAQSLLESVGLSHVRHLFPNEISGGMQKRLGIARAVVLDPEVILYDEPTAGLDPITSRSIASLIADLSKTKQTTVVFITNEMPRAYQLADRIFFLAHGKLTDVGSPQETRKTQDPEIRQFIFGLEDGPLTQRVDP